MSSSSGAGSIVVRTGNGQTIRFPASTMKYVLRRFPEGRRGVCLRTAGTECEDGEAIINGFVVKGSGGSLESLLVYKCTKCGA